MTNQITMALIVARPGPLRNSLQTLMTTMPQIEIVAEAKDVSTLLRSGPRLRPDLVLLEADFPGSGVHELLSQIRSEWSQTRSIVFVENGRQQQEAEAAGADAVLYKGFRAVRLIELIEQLLTSDNSGEYETC